VPVRDSSTSEEGAERAAPPARRPAARALAAFPLFVLVLGALCTLAVSFQLWRVVESRDRERFAYLADERVERIRERLDAYVALLRGAGGLFAATDDVDRTSFHDYVERLALQQRYPGIQGIGFSLHFDADRKDAVVAEMRRQGVAGFAPWPDTPREDWNAILYLEPLDRRNRAAIGYDMFTEPTRRAAMERARDTGVAAMSSRVELVQEIDPSEKQAGFLIYVPVYRGGGALGLEARRRRLEGFVYSAFRAEDLFMAIFRGVSAADVGVAVYDGAPLPANLLHRTTAPAPAPRFAVQRPLRIAGRDWTVQVATLPGFDRGSNRDLVPLARERVAVPPRVDVRRRVQHAQRLCGR